MNRKQRNKRIAAAAATATAHVIIINNRLCYMIKGIAVKHETSLEKSRKKPRLLRKGSLPKSEKSVWRKIMRMVMNHNFFCLLHL